MTDYRPWDVLIQRDDESWVVYTIEKTLREAKIVADFLKSQPGIRDAKVSHYTPSKG